MIASVSYSQDTLCITKGRAIELIKAEIGLQGCDSIRQLQENVIANQINQIDRKDEQIGDYIYKVNTLREMSAKQDTIIQRYEDKLEDCNKDVRKQKFKTWLVGSVGLVAEVLTVYLLVKK